jgi:hypothetical protein
MVHGGTLSCCALSTSLCKVYGGIAGAIRELSVGMCRGNFYVYRDGYGLLAGALGHGFRPGLARPADEVV